MVHMAALIALLASVAMEAKQPSPVPMPAADWYLKIKDIPGESDDASIPLTGLAWDAPAEVGRFTVYPVQRDAASSMAGAREAAPETAGGRRMHMPLTIVKEVDKASPKLMEACTKGTHLGDIEVWSRDGGRGTLRYTLQDAIISSYAISGPSESSSRPIESVSFAYAQIKLGPAAPAVTGVRAPGGR